MSFVDKNIKQVNEKGNILFQNDFLNIISFEYNIKNIFNHEFKESFENILLVKKQNFLNSVKQRVFSILTTRYTNKLFENQNLMQIISKYIAKLNNKYDYVKFSLTETPNTDASTINQNVLAKSVTNLGGSSAITPINTYMNFDKLTRNVLPKDHDYPEGSGSYILLADQNRHDQDLSVFVSNGYLLVKPLAGKDTINGIIISSGDVEFDNSVKSFSGLIIAGGKVYLNNTNVVSNISANSEVCKTVIRQLYAIALDSENPSKADAEYILSLFKGYQNMVSEAEAAAVADGGAPASTGDATSYGELAYSDVVRFDNWIKEVR